jgi:hypothetical protein
MQRVVGNILIGLNALLLVFLLFGDRMQFPAWLQSVGRIHPLLLHIPIGAIVFAVIFLLLKKGTKWILAIGAVTAALTAIMGIILAGEGGYDLTSLSIHKYSGAILSFVLAAAFFYRNQKALVGSSLILVLIAGHFGSILTHGNEFVLAPLLSRSPEQRIVSDSTSLFTAAIQPMFDRKCNGCHNEKKAKGDLVLSTFAGIAKGGEHGAVWLAGSPQASSLMKRILLPEGHKDHMPPSGKAQLSAPEVQLLFQWILSGADTSKAWTRYAPSDTVRRLAESFFKLNTSSQIHYTFDPASPDVIKNLNDPYRTVAPVALEEPALAATFFIRAQYKPSRLEELSVVKEQLVQLNLSKMPVTDEECETIRKFEHLEKLNLNFSSITGKGLKTLSSLKDLKSLSLAGVRLDDEAKETLKEFKNLKNIYFLDTATYANEKLRLTPPVPVSDKTLLDKDEKMSLTHKLRGIVIRYTTDGTDPDSSNAKVFDKPIDINGYTIVKTRACKDGWFCSPVATYVMYRKGVMPEETKLLTAANKDYKGEGAATLTNNKKGFIDDHRDIAWIGFRENPLSAEFKFAQGTNIRKITFSYDHNPDAWLFPPEKIEVWGGKDAGHLELIKQLKPEQPSRNEERKNLALVMPVNGYEFYKIVAWPVPKLPKWHPANKPENKDLRAWLFVDEIIFSE